MTPESEARESANDSIVIAHFSGRFGDVRPRENVKTFSQWLEAGRAVCKGEHGCRITVITERKDESGAVIAKFARTVSVFHEGQTAEAKPREKREQPEATPRTPESPKPRANWDKLRDKAQRERAAAEAVIARPRLTNTRRRMMQAQSIIAENERILATCAIAEHACANPDEAAALRLTSWQFCIDARYGYDSNSLPPTLRAFCEAALTGKADTRASEILRAEQDAIGSGIDHFPTRPELAARMARMACIDDLSDVLEPSCGKGNILQALAATGAACYAIELSHNLRKLAALRVPAKNVTIVHADFLEHEIGYQFDAVVMNPPFSADIEHIRHAWEHLAPGGRLVAIAGESCWSSSRKRGAEEFRAWLHEICASIEHLDGADSFEVTSASARLITATKT
mgnify:CR=1 FL=1